MSSEEMSSTSYKDRYFKGQGPSEVVLAFFRKHWVTIGARVVGFALGVFCAVLAVIYRQILHTFFTPGFYYFVFIVVGALAHISLHRFFLTMISHNMTIVVVTNVRLVALTKTLFLTSDQEAIDLRMIQDIHKYQAGIFQTLFNYGTLRITLSSSATGIELQSVPNPDYYFRLIHRAKREYIERRHDEKVQAYQDEVMHAGRRAEA